MGPHQITNFCIAKETIKIKKKSRPPMEWEKIVAKDTTDKGLTSEICKQCIQFNSKKTNNPTEKYSEHLTDLSPKKT